MDLQTFASNRSPKGFSIPDNPQQYIADILEKNKHLNFVQRILEPEKYPRMDFGDGNWGTHRMSWAGGKPNMVYPNIVQPAANAPLQLLEPQDAMTHAQKTGEFIPFDSPAEADWFGRNYKKFWGGTWR
jgi:hypothetical protein